MGGISPERLDFRRDYAPGTPEKRPDRTSPDPFDCLHSARPSRTLGGSLPTPPDDEADRMSGEAPKPEAPSTPNGENPALDDFLSRWEASGAAERANYALFLTELCDVLGVPRPDPTRPDDAENAYVFERAVTFRNPDGSTSHRPDRPLQARVASSSKPSKAATGPTPRDGRWRSRSGPRRGTAVRGTAGWDEAMLAARGQAEQYVRALPASEPNPPFLVVVDVGHTIELYADFTRQGRTYIPFPDALLPPDQAPRPGRRGDPRAASAGLDGPPGPRPEPSRRRVTRDVAARLAELAKSLEQSGHEPEAVAHFLMRCLFTFFAEDVGLLPDAMASPTCSGASRAAGQPLPRDGPVALGDDEDGRVLADPPRATSCASTAGCSRAPRRCR